MMPLLGNEYFKRMAVRLVLGNTFWLYNSTLQAQIKGLNMWCIRCYKILMRFTLLSYFSC